MPRPDLTEERTEQILDAFARCIARDGVERTSLQDVADEAGVHKSIIRHYIGSRADLVTALSRRTIEGWSQEYREISDASTPAQRLTTVIDLLFDPETVPHEEALFDALTRNPEDYPEATELWLASFRQAVRWLSDELRLAYPDSSASDRRVVAAGVWGLALTADEQIPIEAMSTRMLRRAARRLIATLDNAS